MKKLLYLIPCLMFALTSCELFEFDNMEGHNAKVSGVFVDAKTGDAIPMEVKTSGGYAGFMQVTEKDWDTEAKQSWYVKFDGSFRNNLVWAGDYKLTYEYLNVYDVPNTEFTLKKGDNDNMEFKATPYARVIDPVITYDPAVKKFKATFKVELGDASKANEGISVVLAANTNNFVGSGFNYCANDPEAKKSGVTPGETVTLYLNANPTGVNAAEFQRVRPHYLRICVLVADKALNPNNLYNFSPIYKATPSSGTADSYEIAEYVWED